MNWLSKLFGTKKQPLSNIQQDVINQYTPVFETKPINIKRTGIDVLYKDGSTFHTWVYGEAHRGVSEGYPELANVQIVSSIINAENRIYKENLGDAQYGIVDDPHKTTSKKFGKIDLMRIGVTEDYFMDVPFVHTGWKLKGK